MPMSSAAALVLLLLLQAAHAFAPLKSSARTRRGMPTSIRMTDFNADFKEGLRQVLVAQAAEADRVALPYDSTGSIPDLERKLLSADSAAKPSVDDVIKDAEAAVQAAKEMVASLQTPDMWPAIDLPDLPDTSALSMPDVPDGVTAVIAQMDYTASSRAWQDRVAHPPTLAEFQALGVNADGDGLAAPLVDFVTKFLHEVRDDPDLSPARLLNSLALHEIPPDYQTVAGGFEVKTAALDTFTDIQAKTIESGNSFAEYMNGYMKMAYETGAPLRAGIKGAVDAAATQALANADIIKEKTAANTETAKNSLMQALEVANADIVKAQAMANENVVKVQTLANAEAAKSSLMAQMEYAGRIQASSLGLPVEKFAALYENMQRLFQTPGWKVSELLEVLNFEQLGGYYSGVVVGFLLLAAMNDRKTKASKKVAMKTAAKAKAEAVLKSDVNDAEKAKLEGMVVELTKAVGILMEELKDLKAQKAKTDYALATLKSDVRSVKNEYEVSATAEDEIMKKLKETNEKYDAVQTKLDTAQVEVDTLREINEVLDATSSKQGGTAAKPPVQEVLASVGNDAVGAKKETGGINEKEPFPPKNPPPQAKGMTEGVFDFFFSDVVEKEPKGKGKSGDDWSSLSASALKNKPASELMDYLQEKGVTPTSEDGKPLEKDVLVETVLAFAP